MSGDQIACVFFVSAWVPIKMNEYKEDIVLNTKLENQQPNNADDDDDNNNDFLLMLLLQV